MQQITNLKEEVTQLRDTVESMTPKFGNYDEMLATNNVWKAQVQATLEKHNVDQLALIAEQAQTMTNLQQLHGQAHESLSQTNTKLLALERSGVVPSYDARLTMGLNPFGAVTEARIGFRSCQQDPIRHRVGLQASANLQSEGCQFPSHIGLNVEVSRQF